MIYNIDKTLSYEKVDISNVTGSTVSGSDCRYYPDLGIVTISFTVKLNGVAVSTNTFGDVALIPPAYRPTGYKSLAVSCGDGYACTCRIVYSGSTTKAGIIGISSPTALTTSATRYYYVNGFYYI